MNDILVNKIQSIQRCIKRARSEYDKNPAEFNSDFTAQDAAVLNILRACEQAIDLANHTIRSYKMGIPNSSSESFDLLYKQNIISAKLTDQLKKMARFRNMIIHQYEKMDIEIIERIIKDDIGDLLLFADKIREFWYNDPE